MASADAALRVDTPNRMRFAHAPSGALFFTIVSLGFTWACWTFIDDAPAIRYGFTAFTLLFVIAGLFGIFWRNEIDIDLTGRRVRIRRGFWPNARITERPLDDADGIFLTMKYRSSGSKNSKRKVPWWFISLRFPEDKKGTSIFASSSEVAAYEKWEHYAKRFALDAVDATDKESSRKSWRDLDDNLAAQAREAGHGPSRAPTRPSDSKVQIISSVGQREYVLPMPGFSWGLVFLVAFGSVFFTFGAVPVLAALGVFDIEVNGSEIALMIVPPLFMLVGFAIIWFGIKGSYTSVVVGAARNELFTEQFAFGKRSSREAISLSDIESIELGGDVRARRRNGGYIRIGGLKLGSGKYRDRNNEVIVRADGKILRFGSKLSDADKTWLAEACSYAALRGSLP